MAFWNISPTDVITLINGEASTTIEKCRIVKPATDADFKVKIATAGSTPLWGVTVNAAAAGAPASVQFSGIAKVEAGGSINQGDPVIATTAGKAAAGSNGAGLSYIVGYALENAASNDFVSVLIRPCPVNGATT